MIVSIIVAMDEAGGIGKDNRLPWHLPDDLKRFKQLTMGHFLILGRKTFESLPKPLIGRKIIVVSARLKKETNGRPLARNAGVQDEGINIPVHFAGSIEEALEYANNHEENEVFIGGGEKIYRAVFPLAQRIYLTKVHARVDADVFFPSRDWDEWTVVSRESHPSDERHDYSFEFLILEKV